MEFAERFAQVVKDRGISQAELSRRLEVPYSSFRYKSRKLSAWNAVEPEDADIPASFHGSASD